MLDKEKITGIDGEITKISSVIENTDNKKHQQQMFFEREGCSI